MFTGFKFSNMMLLQTDYAINYNLISSNIAYITFNFHACVEPGNSIGSILTTSAFPFDTSPITGCTRIEYNYLYYIIMF